MLKLLLGRAGAGKTRALLERERKLRLLHAGTFNGMAELIYVHR